MIGEPLKLWKDFSNTSFVNEICEWLEEKHYAKSTMDLYKNRINAVLIFLMKSFSLEISTFGFSQFIEYYPSLLVPFYDHQLFKKVEEWVLQLNIGASSKRNIFNVLEGYGKHMEGYRYAVCPSNESKQEWDLRRQVGGKMKVFFAEARGVFTKIVNKERLERHTIESQRLTRSYVSSDEYKVLAEAALLVCSNIIKAGKDISFHDAMTYQVAMVVLMATTIAPQRTGWYETLGLGSNVFFQNNKWRFMEGLAAEAHKTANRNQGFRKFDFPDCLQPLISFHVDKIRPTLIAASTLQALKRYRGGRRSSSDRIIDDHFIISFDKNGVACNFQETKGILLEEFKLFTLDKIGRSVTFQQLRRSFSSTLYGNKPALKEIDIMGVSYFLDHTVATHQQYYTLISKSVSTQQLGESGFEYIQTPKMQDTKAVYYAEQTHKTYVSSKNETSNEKEKELSEEEELCRLMEELLREVASSVNGKRAETHSVAETCQGNDSPLRNDSVRWKSSWMAPTTPLKAVPSRNRREAPSISPKYTRSPGTQPKPGPRRKQIDPELLARALNSPVSPEKPSKAYIAHL